MRVFNSLEEIPAFTHAAVTLGTFDGVHRGHRQILDCLIETAQQNQGESVLLTFWPHPRMVLYPDDTSLKLLNTIDEKVELLSQTGIDNLVIVPFTFAFSRTPYLEFIRDIMVGALQAKSIVVGYDHHFGKNREGTFEQLQECAPVYNFELKQVPALMIDDVAVSSSKIRTALLDRDTEKANMYLGYPYSVTGKVVKGKQLGRELGYPTANIEIAENYKLIPAEGIYVVQAHVRGQEYQGMASIGYNPTFGDKNAKTIEINLFDFEEDIYSEKMRVEFLAFLREEVKFANTTALVQQIHADKQNALEYFANL